MEEKIKRARELCGCTQCQGGYDIGPRTLAAPARVALAPSHEARPHSCVAAIVLRSLLKRDMSIVPRPEVRWFAEQMESKLRENDHKNGKLDDSPSELFKRMVQEVEEVDDAMRISGHGVIVQECADVANFAMMIAHSFR